MPFPRTTPHRTRVDGPAPGDLSDEALLARVAVSDAEAAAVFVQRFQRRVFGLALAIVGETRAAEDVAQEALIRAWRHGASYDVRRGSVQTWLLTITRNLAIDAIRVRRPVSLDPDDLPHLCVPAPGRDPADLVALRGDADGLREALTRLPDKQRRAVVLASIWGLSAREIAEHEDIPLGTAKTRIRAALTRLRETLTAEAQTQMPAPAALPP